ncbi:uncharacterized protein [Antedon mediterranea]|uniref:uncharacterized protein n=1 Tax=Antedon mediterranea TaxID=105859 RepID=UPI003AF6027E
MAASMPTVDGAFRKKEEMEEKINLAALQQCDPNITGIIATASQVALYRFTTEWEKTETEGTLFVYSRSAIPYHGFMIMNRLSTENWTEPINKELEFQLHEPFLLYRTSKAIFGLWFYKPEDCHNVCELMQSLTEKAKLEKKVRQRSMSESDGGYSPRGPVDILQMLNRAQNEYLESQGSEQIPTGEQSTEMTGPLPPVAIKPESQVDMSKVRPMLNRSISMQHGQQAAHYGQGIHPVLQKLLSHPGEGAVPLPANNVHTVESIEKLHVDEEKTMKPISVGSIEGVMNVGEYMAAKSQDKITAPLQDFLTQLNITSILDSESNLNKNVATIEIDDTSGQDMSRSKDFDINQALLANLKGGSQQAKTGPVPSLGHMAAMSVGAGNALLLGLQQQANMDTTTKPISSAPLLLAPSAFRPRAASDTPTSKPSTTSLQSPAAPSSIPPIASSFTQAEKMTLLSSSPQSRDMRQQQSFLSKPVDAGQQVLNREQFRDAFVHLLQTDSTFVDKLFSSYLQTAQK